MLNENVFKNCLVGLCKMNGVSIEQDTLRMYYAKVKNDFTDDEFKSMANDILETENLYGKFPAPVLFYSRKKKAESVVDNSKQAEARQIFVDKVMDLATMDYVPNDWKKELMDSLSPSEIQALAECGGFGAIWGAMRKGGVYNTEAEHWVVKDLSAAFDRNYNAQAEEVLKIGVERDEEMALQIADLTKNLLKGV